MKKSVLCILLALLLCLSLGAPALALDNDNDLHIFDLAELLTDDEWDALEEWCWRLGDDYKIGVYAIIVEDYTAYLDEGETFDDLIKIFYEANEFGIGDDYDGVLLLLSTDGAGAYGLYSHGPEGAEAFNSDALDFLDNRLSDFYMSDEWTALVTDYVDACDGLLQLYAGGEPYAAADTRSGPFGEFAPGYYFYDQTDVTDAAEKADLEERLMNAGGNSGVGVYAVILPEPGEDGKLSPLAPDIFETCGMGQGDDKEGVLLLAETSSGRVTLYTSGPKAGELFTDEVWNALFEDFDAAPTYYDGIVAYAEDCGMVLRGEAVGAGEGTSASDKTGETPSVIAPAPTAAPAAAAADDDTVWHVYDIAGLLTDAELDALEEKLTRISERYDCGVYIATVDDYTAYGYGSIEDISESLYYNTGLGTGPNRDGLFLFMSMADRDYDFFRNGWGNEAVSSRGKDRIVEAFKDDFRYNDWYSGFNDFADECEEMLRLAEAGEPYGVGLSNGAKVAIILIPALLIAGIACAIMLAKMKSVRRAADADAYAAPGSMHLTESSDVFTHTTETRRKIESSSRSGGGGGSSHSSGKF